MNPYGGPHRAGRHMKWLVFWLGSLALLGIGVTVFLGAVLTYQPYMLERYALQGEAFCPAAETRTAYDANAERPLLGSISLITNRSEWVSADGKTRIPVEPFTAPFDGEYGVRGGVSERVRYAPTRPGRWHLEATLEVRGFQLLKRELQIIPGVVTPTVTVLEPTAQKCLMAEAP